MAPWVKETRLFFCEVKSSKKNEKNNDLRCQVEHLDDALKSMNSSESLRYIRGRIWKHKPSKTKKRNSARTENKLTKLNLQKGGEVDKFKVTEHGHPLE